MISYEIQGRKTERGSNGRVVRDHVRLASADDEDAAFRVAATMVTEEFTVWVFKTEQRSGKTSYTLLGVVPER